MTNLNLDQARFNMIEQQLRTWNILDQETLDLMQRMPRENFVPAEYKDFAFSDISIPLGHGRAMLPPSIEAHILQAVKVQPKESVLLIGTGSGHLTALLASQGRHVVSVDIDEAISKVAAEKLAEQKITNVTLEVGDASHGWDKQKPYDVIVISGSLPILPESFQRSLNVGGRLFAIIGEAPAMEVVLITRTGDNEWQHKILFETDIPSLDNAPEPERFSL